MKPSLKRAIVAGAVVLAVILTFSASTAGKEPAGPLEPVATVTPISPTDGDSGGEVDSYVPPDPCGLEVVVCDGEEERPLRPYVPPAYRIVTAYSSDEWQTDASPCIAADGSNICERAEAGETICAANFVPFGTLLILDNQAEPDGTDAIVCVVADRMASKHPDRVDLYFRETDQAIAFGAQVFYVSEYGD